MAIKQTSEQSLALLKSHEGEPVKQHITLDAQSRPDRVYTIHFTGKNGEPCLVTKYEYLSPTSSIVIKRNEYLDTWVSATMNSAHVDIPDALKE